MTLWFGRCHPVQRHGSTTTLPSAQGSRMAPSYCDDMCVTTHRAGACWRQHTLEQYHQPRLSSVGFDREAPPPHRQTRQMGAEAGFFGASSIERAPKLIWSLQEVCVAFETARYCVAYHSFTPNRGHYVVLHIPFSPWADLLSWDYVGPSCELCSSPW